MIIDLFGEKAPYSASNLFGKIISAWLARLLNAGTTSGATYRRASSPMTGSSARLQPYQRSNT